MRRSTGLLVLAVVAALPVAAAPSAARERGSCTPRGSKTLAHSRDARVFRGASGAFYGCLTHTGARTFLATKSVPIDNVRTAGPFAAFSRAGFRDGESGDQIPATVSSIGLCRGEKGRAPRRYKYIVQTADSVTDLVLSRDGDVAWIAAVPGGVPTVYKLDADAQRDRSGGAKPVEVGSGTGVDPRSLALNGDRLSWREDGQSRSDTLKRRVATCRG
jgi:hypothetical protein